jgi:hypothetical protein
MEVWEINSGSQNEEGTNHSSQRPLSSRRNELQPSTMKLITQT